MTDPWVPSAGAARAPVVFLSAGTGPHGAGSTDGYCRCCWCFSGEEREPSGRSRACVSDSYSALVHSTRCLWLLKLRCAWWLPGPSPAREARVKWPAASKGLGAGGQSRVDAVPLRLLARPQDSGGGHGGGLAAGAGSLHEAWHTHGTCAEC